MCGKKSAAETIDAFISSETHVERRLVLGDVRSNGILLEAAAIITTLDENVAIHTPVSTPGVLDNPVRHLLTKAKRPKGEGKKREPEVGSK